MHQTARSASMHNSSAGRFRKKHSYEKRVVCSKTVPQNGILRLNLK